MNTQINRTAIRTVLLVGALAALAAISGCCWGYGYYGGCGHGGGHWHGGGVHGGHCH